LQHDLKDLGTYGTVGLEFGLSVLAGLLMGQWLDKKFHTDPWLSFVGMSFGVAAGVRTLLRASRKAQQEIEAEDQRELQARREYHERSRRK